MLTYADVLQWTSSVGLDTASAAVAAGVCVRARVHMRVRFFFFVGGASSIFILNTGGSANLREQEA